MKALLLSIIAMSLVSCGGNGELDPQAVQSPPSGEQPTPTPPRGPVTSPPPAADPVPVGVWVGETRNLHESIYGVVLPSAEFWFVYGMSGAPDWAGGVAHGTMVGGEDQTWRITDALYVDQGRRQRGTLTATGTWTPMQTLDGGLVVRYNDTPHFERPDALHATSHPSSETALHLLQAAGRYVGSWAPVEIVTIDLASDGFITGRTEFGCTFQGQVTPEGPVALGSITFNGPPCVNLTATVRSVIGWRSELDQLIVAGLSANNEDALTFMGYRAR